MKRNSPGVLEAELKAFGRLLPRLLKDKNARGKYVAIRVVKGKVERSPYMGEMEAVGYGFQTWGHVPFLVKEIAKENPNDLRYFLPTMI